MVRRFLRGQRTPKHFPTASGGIARLAYQQAQQARIDTEPFFKRTKLTLQQVTDDRIRLSVKAQIEFLNLVANALADDFLGVRLAQMVDLRELGLLYYVLASSEKLTDALARAERYSGIHNEGIEIAYHQHRGSVTFHHVGICRTSDRHQIEFFVTVLLRMCRHLTGRQLVPESIKFIHLRSPLPSDLKVFFGCDVSFGNRIDEVVFAKDAVAKTVVSADRYLNTLLEKFCDEALAERRTASGDWRLRVENAIVPLLPHGQASIVEVCRQLGVSSRTLARRLKLEGHTFAEVLEALRSDLAKKYLLEPELTISEIAWLLGYRQTSSLNHAFKRWTGKSPALYRRDTNRDHREKYHPTIMGFREIERRRQGSGLRQTH
jgi:AraC-like DNA-binding protein